MPGVHELIFSKSAPFHISFTRASQPFDRSGLILETNIQSLPERSPEYVPDALDPDNVSVAGRTPYPDTCPR